MTRRAGIEWKKRLILAVFAFALLWGSTIHAQSLSVTVTPPLFQLTIGPGETWVSSIKVVNNNDYDVTYYTRVVDMEASGEEGRSKFTPLINLPPETEGAPSTLARWIDIPATSFTIGHGKSADIPFTVTIPTNASPGGHYAAILVGTEPGDAAGQGSMMKVSSFVSSLIFVRIKGDVIESGRIREFRTDKSLYQVPEADFVVRFENMGNTHLRPEGEIAIYNMWGKERGKVLINQETNFGNVLPQSVRRFEFSWQGERSIFDVGRYSAEVTLTYGEDGKKNVTDTAYFWVIPVVPVTIGLLACLAFLAVVVWLVRRYVRRALLLERMRLGIEIGAPMVRPPVIETIVEPIRAGVIDLRSISSGRAVPNAAPDALTKISTERQTAYQPSLTIGEFFGKYKLFFLFIAVVVLGVMGVLRYFDKVLVDKRSFEIRDVKVQLENPQ